MKKLLITTAIIAALSSPVLAQTSDMTTTATATEATPELFRAEQAAGDILASDFIGMRVYAASKTLDATTYQGVQPDWDDIGEINDVVLSQTGQVEAALVDIGGFLGIGERKVALDMNAIKFVKDDGTGDNPDDFFLVVTADRSLLENAPPFGARVLGNSAATDPGMTDTTASGMAVAPADQVATTDDTTMRAPMARDGYTALKVDTLTAEQLTGSGAYDPTDKRIGEVSELIVGSDGRITQAVVDVGGFLGIGEKRVALPMNDIDIMEAAETKEIRVYVPFTKDQLKAMPTYQS